MKKEQAKQVWVRLPVSVLKKLDLIAKRMARSRQKQMLFMLTQAVNDSYLQGERASK